MSTPPEKVTTNDPRFILVTMEGLREAMRTIVDKARGGDLIDVPATYTATAMTSGTGDIMLQTDEPPDDTGIQPIMYAQTVIGPVRAGTRVQVMHEGAGNLIIGTVPDADQWALPADADAWQIAMSTDSGAPISLDPAGTWGFWHQDGPALDVAAAITFAAAPPAGVFQLNLPAPYVHAGSTPAMPVRSLPCGDGWALSGVGLRVGFLVVHDTTGLYLNFIQVAQSSPGFTFYAASTTPAQNIPWVWRTGDVIFMRARVMLPPPT